VLGEPGRPLVTVAAGELHAVRDGELRRLEYARLVRKGGTPLKLVHGPQAGYRFRTGLTAGSSLCHGVFAGWNVELRHLSITPREFPVASRMFDEPEMSRDYFCLSVHVPGLPKPGRIVENSKSIKQKRPSD